jgi:branched-chain amino acid transport system substrate-binding protein
MGTVGRTVLAVTLAGIVGLGSAIAAADGVSDGVVKIGVLTDMSGQFSHESGEGAVTAVRMAIEDFGGKVLGKPDRACRRRSSEQTRHSLRHRPQMVRR